MKDLTAKGLGGASGIAKLFNIGKANKAQPANKIGNIQMTGVYASGGELSIRSKSSIEVSPAIVNKYADVAFADPKGCKPLSDEIGSQPYNEIDRASDRFLEEQPEFA